MFSIKSSCLVDHGYKILWRFLPYLSSWRSLKMLPRPFTYLWIFLILKEERYLKSSQRSFKDFMNIFLIFSHYISFKDLDKILKSSLYFLIIWKQLCRNMNIKILQILLTQLMEEEEKRALVVWSFKIKINS